MLANRIEIGPATTGIGAPLELSHLDSDRCWCDPVVEQDENGKEVVVHREVRWN